MSVHVYGYAIDFKKLKKFDIRSFLPVIRDSVRRVEKHMKEHKTDSVEGVEEPIYFRRQYDWHSKIADILAGDIKKINPADMANLKVIIAYGNEKLSEVSGLTGEALKEFKKRQKKREEKYGVYDLTPPNFYLGSDLSRFLWELVSKLNGEGIKWAMNKPSGESYTQRFLTKADLYELNTYLLAIWKAKSGLNLKKAKGLLHKPIRKKHKLLAESFIDDYNKNLHQYCYELMFLSTEGIKKYKDIFLLSVI